MADAKKSKPSEAYRFSQVVARDILQRAREMDRAAPTKLMVMSGDQTVAIYKVQATAAGLPMYVVEEIKYTANSYDISANNVARARSLTFLAVGLAVECFATSVLACERSRCGGMDNIPRDRTVDFNAIPPGTDRYNNGMAVLNFCPRAMDKTHQGNRDIARRTTGTIESQFADHAAKMKLLAQMVEAQPRPSDAAGPWLGPSE